MARRLHIEIPSACHERWQDMDPRQDGRYCGSCQKTVVDFTGMSDTELAHYFRNYTGNTCGRFDNVQLNRVLRIPSKPMPGLRYFFTIALPAIFWSVKSAAQGQGMIRRQETVQRQETAARQKQMVTATTGEEQDTLTLRGRIHDANGAPASFVTIVERGTHNSVTTDKDGNFRIRVSKLPVALQTYSMGYQSMTYRVTKASDFLNLAIIQSDQQTTMGLIAVRPVKKPVQEEPGFQLRVFPNPASAGTPVRVNGADLLSGSYSLQLWNSAGVQVRSCQGKWLPKRADPMELNTDGLFAGTYVLRAVHTKTGKVFSQQLIVQP